MSTFPPFRYASAFDDLTPGEAEFDVWAKTPAAAALAARVRASG